LTPNKPPLGLVPEHIYEEDRQYDRLLQLSDAISRYAINGMPIPIEWAGELKRRIDEYRDLSMRSLNRK